MLDLLHFGGGETVLILAVILILFGGKRLPGLARGLRRGIFEFRKEAKRLRDGIDEGAYDAGRSLGGIYGKPAAQALTPGNRVAELYDPAVFQRKEQPRKLFKRIVMGFRRLWMWASRFLR